MDGIVRGCTYNVLVTTVGLAFCIFRVSVGVAHCPCFGYCYGRRCWIWLGSEVWKIWIESPS
jgi:hypothetical protein